MFVNNLTSMFSRRICGWNRSVKTYFFILHAVILIVSSNVSADNAHHDFYPPELSDSYSKPIAVQSDNNLDAALAAEQENVLPINAEGKAGGSNTAYEFVALSAKKSDRIGDTVAPPGDVFITVQVRLTHIHRKGIVAVDDLEGKQDVTMGAGGLFGGTDTNSREKVSAEYTVEIKTLVDHFYGVADGVAYRLSPESNQLNENATSKRAVQLTRQGESTVLNLVYQVPETSEDVGIRYFDNALGNITLPVSGNSNTIASEVPIECPVVSMSHEFADVCVHEVVEVPEFEGYSARAGRRLLRVRFSAESHATSGENKAVWELKPDGYLWIKDASNRFEIARPVPSSLLSFSYDIASMQSVVFEVAEDFEASEIGMQLRNDVITAPLGSNSDSAAPSGIGQFIDGEKMAVTLHGLARDGEYVIADIEIQSLQPSLRIPISAARRLQLVDGDKTVSYDQSATKQRRYGKANRFEIPPAQTFRFELAYKMSNPPSALRVRGFDALGDIDANTGKIAPVFSEEIGVDQAEEEEESASDDELVLAGRTDVLPDTTVDANNEGASVFAVMEDLLQEPETLNVKIENDVNEVMEAEPNDDRSIALDLGELASAFIVSGRFDDLENSGRKRDRDVYSFDITGDPQLWFFSMSSSIVKSLDVRDEAGNYGFSIQRSKKSSNLVIPNVLLNKGRYFIEINSDLPEKNTDNNYRLTVSPRGSASAAEEAEPNDRRSYAESLTKGGIRSGYLSDEFDRDLYRFSINAENEKIAFLIKSPPNMKLGMNLDEDLSSNRFNRIYGTSALSAGEDLRGVLSLQPGSYTIKIRAEDPGSELKPYQILLERLNRFEQIADVEPNDSIHIAGRFPDRGVIVGRLAGSGDAEDWYQLPKGSSQIKVTLPDAAEYDSKPNLRATYHDTNGKRLTELKWDKEALAYVGEYDPDVAAYIRLRGKHIAYTITRSEDSILIEPDSFSMEILDTDLSVESFIDFSQELHVPVLIKNNKNKPQRFTIKAHTNHYGWKASSEKSEVLLDANEYLETSVLVDVLPDAPENAEAMFDIEIKNDAGLSIIDSAPLVAECGIPARLPHHPWVIPEALLGGRNVADIRFGASLHNLDRFQRNKSSLLRRQLELVTPDPANNGYWWATVNDDEPDEEVFIKLAGSEPILVAGSIFRSSVNRVSRETPTDLEVFLSIDGIDYQSVWRGKLPLTKTEHSVVFDEPVRARYAKLLVHAAGVDSKTASLAQWKIVSVPGSSHSGNGSINIASAEFGGHIVSASTKSLTSTMRQALDNPDRESQGYARYEADTEHSWIMGFHEQRVARLASIQWNHTTSENANRSFAANGITVEASLVSPLGPWETVGNLEFDDDATTTFTGPEILKFEELRWAKYLKFTLPNVSKTTNILLPHSIDVREYPEQDGYLSILGEWGGSTNRAYYDLLNHSASPSSVTKYPENTTRASATELSHRASIRNRVLLGEYDNWYYVDIAEGKNKLSLDIEGDTAISMQFELIGKDEMPVKLSKNTASNGRLRLSAAVEPGRYYLKVIEPPRSIVIAWDRSGSVSEYLPVMLNAVDQFTQQVQPDLEVANLMPLNEHGTLLLNEFSSDPAVLNRALRDDENHGGSSAAELNLLGATEALGDRAGAKAVLLLTDGESGADPKITSDLWHELSKVRPRIFTMAILGSRASNAEDRMQNWAAAQSGHYSKFNTSEELTHGFQRASCYLRRPAGYSIVSNISYDAPPEPGTLQLVEQTEQTELSASGALELILDASGSMHKRLGDSTRLKVSQEILSDLVTNVIPADTPVALRVFGNREERTCRTDLEIPLAPANPTELASAIQNVNAQAYAKTPLADSLRLVASDLKSVTGPKNVILVTDGEESCGGDPAAAIASLRNQGIDVRINIVGFAIDDKALKDSFASWAELGGGTYYDAPDAETLKAGLQQALRHPYEVVDSDGKVIASGVVGGKPIEIPEGVYQINVLSDPVRRIEDVTVISWELNKISVQ